MKIKLNTKNVKEILKKAKRIYDKKTVKPILEYLLIGENGNITVSDYKEIQATFFPEIVKISDDRGSYCVDLITFKKAVDKIKSDTFELDLQNNKCIITFKNIEIKIPVGNADDYPIMEKTTYNPQVLEIETDKLKIMLEKTLYCACGDELVRNLNGVLFEMTDKKLTIVTADSYRMALAETEISDCIDTNKLDNPITYSNPLGNSGNVFLPLKPLVELYNSLKHSKDDKVKISFYNGYTTVMINEKTEIFFKIKNKNVSFPNYKAVLPENFETEIIIEKKQAIETVEIAKELFKTKGDTIKFVMNGKIEVKARSMDIGDFDAVLDGEKKGNDNVIAFDPFYILDGFKKIDGDNVRMQFVDNNNALQMTEVDDDQFIHIIMPVKIRS